MRRRRWVLAGLGVLVVLGAWGLRPFFISSPSPSLPTGLYVHAVPIRGLRVGDFIVIETPEVLKPSLPPGYEDKPLLKQVAGLAGMEVCWGDEAMVVEGRRRYAYHAAQPARTTFGCQTLGTDNLLLSGTDARSYDSRYVGVVSTRLVRFRVWPLWTKDSS